jgi:hypothetical protein
MKPYGVKRTALISLVASGVMALPMLGTRLLVSRLWLPGVAGVLTQVVFVGGVGAFTYLFVMRQLGWEELELLRRAALRRWNRRFPTE